MTKPRYLTLRQSQIATYEKTLWFCHNLWSKPCCKLCPITLKTCFIYLGEYLVHFWHKYWKRLFISMLALIERYIHMRVYIWIISAKTKVQSKPSRKAWKTASKCFRYLRVYHRAYLSLIQEVLFSAPTNCDKPENTYVAICDSVVICDQCQGVIKWVPLHRKRISYTWGSTPVKFSHGYESMNFCQFWRYSNARYIHCMYVYEV